MDVVSIRHKGLRTFYEQDDTKGLKQDQVRRVRAVLTVLHAATTVAELATPPGWRLHELKGDRAGTWSISISGNWRLTFRVVDDQIHDMDLEDYH